MEQTMPAELAETDWLAQRGAPAKLAWSIRGAAEATSLSERSLWLAIREGKLRALRIGGRTLIATRDLEAFLGIGQ
jgi:excisionase family DNA binding protein